MKFGEINLVNLLSRSLLGTDANGKIIDGLTAADARYLLLDQTTPQTMTGLTDGALGLISGVFSIIGSNVDGGFANSVYLLIQKIDGGGA